MLFGYTGMCEVLVDCLEVDDIIHNGYRDVRFLGCCINSDERLGVIVTQVDASLYPRSESDEDCFMLDDDDDDDDLGFLIRCNWLVVCSVVDMRSCAIIGCFSERLFYDYGFYGTIDPNVFASTSFLGIICYYSTHTTVDIVDIKSQKRLARFSELLDSDEGERDVFSADSNVVAISNQNGSVSFIKIHVPE